MAHLTHIFSVVQTMFHSFFMVILSSTGVCMIVGGACTRSHPSTHSHPSTWVSTHAHMLSVRKPLLLTPYPSRTLANVWYFSTTHARAPSPQYTGSLGWERNTNPQDCNVFNNRIIRDIWCQRNSPLIVWEGWWERASGRAAWVSSRVM